MKTPGQIAYETYAAHFPGPASGMSFPWDRLSEGVRLAWERAGEAVKAA